MIRDFKSLFESMTQEVFKKEGFANPKILANWHAIMGAQLAKIVTPVKISFDGGKTQDGCLHVELSNPSYALEIKSLEARIVERIATYFGYRAVSRIKISVKPKKRDIIRPAPQSEAPTSSTPVELPPELEKVKDDELKAALASLYQSLK